MSTDLEKSIPKNPYKLFYLFINQITVLPQHFPLYLSLPQPPPYLAMNVLQDAVFSNVLHDKFQETHHIMASVSFDPEAVHPKIEETKKDIQYATSDELFNITAYNKNLLNKADDKINYINKFLQANHLYPGTSATPISQFSSPYA